jgi:hypothetical protein
MSPPRRREPSDTGPTPRYVRAQSASGEIDSDDGIPIDIDPGDEGSFPVELRDSPEMTLFAKWARQKFAEEARRLSDRVLEVQAAVQHQAHDVPSGKARTRRDLVVGVTVVLISSLLAFVGAGYESARSEIASQHDAILTLTQRVKQNERTLGAVIVPALAPSILRPPSLKGLVP